MLKAPSRYWKKYYESIHILSERWYTYHSMKRKISLILIFAFGFFMILPSAGYSQHRGYSEHSYGHGHYDGWLPAAILAGTLLTSVIITGVTNRNTQTSHQPPPIYVDPGPTVYYPPSSQPYDAPDPEFSAKYGKQDPSGEWVNVPGQWVGDTWVPQHKVFVPTNP